jgi:hypothetical protein
MAMEGKRERPEEDRQKPEDGMDLGTFLPSVKAQPAHADESSRFLVHFWRVKG